LRIDPLAERPVRSSFDAAVSGVSPAFAGRRGRDAPDVARPRSLPSANRNAPSMRQLSGRIAGMWLWPLIRRGRERIS
jgi:hypothetical protein